MSNFKTILTITAASVFATAACAQSSDDAPILDTAPDTMASDFSAADIDADGQLNADEFVTFAVMRADAGEADYKDLVLGGQYDDKFAMHDADASGGLDAAELGADSDETPMDDGVEEMLEPELD